VSEVRLDVLAGPATSGIASDLRAIYLSALAQPPFGEGEEQANWLVTYPFDCPAVRLYRSRGWIELGRGPLGMRSAERVVMGIELGA